MSWKKCMPMLLISLVTVLSLGLAACGAPSPEPTQAPATEEPPVEEEIEEPAEPTEEAEPPAEEDEEPAADEVVELTVWDIPESETYVEWWQDYVADFNEAHPNIHVTWESFESEPYKQKIQSALVAGTAPDIFYTIPGQITDEHYRQGRMLAVEDLFDVSSFTEAGRSACSVDGEMVCLPLYFSVSSMYYNKQQFADAGVDVQDWADPLQPTWDEFIAACEALKAAGYVPIAMGNEPSWPLMTWLWGSQNRYGGTEEFFDAVNGDGSYAAPGFLKGAQRVQDLASRGYFPEGYNGIGGSDKYTMFPLGTGAIMYYGPWVIGIIDENAPEGFEYGMFKFPSFPDGNPDSQDDIEAGIDAYFVSGTTEHPEAVAEFLAPLATIDVAVSFMKATNFSPAVEGLLEAAENADIHPAVLQLAEYVAQAEHQYPWWDWALSAEVAEEMLNMSQPLALGEITPEEFVERLEAKAGR